MLPAGFGRDEAFPKLTIAGVVQAPFPGIVLGTPNAVDWIIGPVTFAYGVATFRRKIREG